MLVGDIDDEFVRLGGKAGYFDAAVDEERDVRGGDFETDLVDVDWAEGAVHG